MALLDRVRRYIDAKSLMKPHVPLLVGVSGGADSMVLMEVLHRLEYPLVVVHVNYGLRGAAAGRDEELVRRRCQELSVGLEVTACDAEAYARQHDLSVQAAAREQRYRYLEEVAKDRGIDHVAVGHHRDDQAETVLLNLFRGTGPEGLAGMPPVRPLFRGSPVQLVRPLLEESRSVLEAYAAAEGIPWRTDETNASLKYRRGALREEVIPLVQEHLGEAAPRKVAEAAQLMRDYLDEQWTPELRERFTAAAREEEGGGTLDLDVLRQNPAVWSRRLILEALRQWIPAAPRRHAVAAAISQLIDAQPGRRVELNGGTIWRERGRLRFRVRGRDDLPSSGRLRIGETLSLSAGILSVEHASSVPDDLGASSPETVYADGDRVADTLTVRPWAPGDRFRPLGMHNSKKVSDFLTDAKVPPSERDEVLVLRSESRILWVVGHRLAHPARIRRDTARPLKMTFARRSPSGTV